MGKNYFMVLHLYIFVEQDTRVVLAQFGEVQKSAKMIFFVKLSVITFILDEHDVLKEHENFTRFRNFMVVKY